VEHHHELMRDLEHEPSGHERDEQPLTLAAERLEHRKDGLGVRLNTRVERHGADHVIDDRLERPGSKNAESNLRTRKNRQPGDPPPIRSKVPPHPALDRIDACHAF
jgi:hypothetical protein